MLVPLLAGCGSTPPPRQIAERISVPGGPGVAEPVTLDATLYLPEHTPAPAVILAHGFGGTKQSVAAQAEDLAGRGLVALAYSARGFGDSTGQIGLDSLDYEVPDARALVTWLAGRPEVLKDRPGDPRVGVVGGSYGGALALMLAGTDHRVDAVVAAETWNNLGQALFPNALANGPAPATPAATAWAGDGVFKRSWAAALIASVTSGTALGAPGTPGLAGLPGAGSASAAAPVPGGGGSSDASAGSDTRPPSAGGPDARGRSPGAALGCGRLMPQICAEYAGAAQTGRLTPEMAALLGKSSPAAVVGRITAPTLLVQGERDTLFGLGQADANARAIAASGTTVAVSWFNGGHDAGGPDAATQSRMDDWLLHYLTGSGPVPATSFDYVVAGPVSDTGRARTRTLQAPAYPGLPGIAPTPRARIAVSGPSQLVINPPGGVPAAITSLPGLGDVGASVVGAASLPGQTARFDSAALAEPIVVTGTSRVTVQVQRLPDQQAAGSASSAVLYASLWKVDQSGNRTLAGSAVAPIRIGTPAVGQTATAVVDLPAVAFQVEAGSRLEVQVATTNFSFAGPSAPAAYRISLTGDASVPEVIGRQVSGSGIPAAALAGAIVLAALLLLALLLGGRVWARRGSADPALAETPLAVTDLGKSYRGSVTAVSDATFTVQRGQVLGLLGENGAGKTTTLRMAMGLIMPSAGRIRIFGRLVRPGDPVLARVGSLLEGPGFLPHLSGRANLELYWRATGRPPTDSHLADVLAIAGLGTAVDRRVKTYSQGMRQRLAIAQAMLGLPDLLILDEPTNGLDPPQIHAMREVLHAYAASGRTVVLSSHLLAEVEQTCTHVVVMHRGRTVAAGPVEAMIAASGEMTFAVDDPAGAAMVLRGLPGVTSVVAGEDSVRANVGRDGAVSTIRSLVQASVALASAAPRHRLEDVFLELIADGHPDAPAGTAPGSNGAAPARPQPPTTGNGA